MVSIIFSRTLILLKCLFFGAGGAVVFVGKNLALCGAALYCHHADLTDALTAVSPFIGCVLLDALWYGGIAILSKERCQLRLKTALACWRRKIGFAGAHADAADGLAYGGSRGG